MTTGLIDGISGDKRVGELERELGLPPGTVRNKNGRDTRSDKKVSTIRREMRPLSDRARRLRRKLKRAKRVTPSLNIQQSLPLEEPVKVELAGGESGEITPVKEAAIQ